MTRTDEWMKNYLHKKWNLPDTVEMDLSGLKIRPVEKKEDKTVDLSQLTYNDTITYTCGYTTQSGIEDQDASKGSYTSQVVDIGEKLVEVRADGMHGCAPLYIVFKSDVLRIEGGQNER
jgi:hypothetical protein